MFASSVTLIVEVQSSPRNNLKYLSKFLDPHVTGTVWSAIRRGPLRGCVVGECGPSELQTGHLI